MLIQFDPCLIDQYVGKCNEDRDRPGNFTFDSVGSIAVCPRKDLFVGGTAETAAAKAEFLSIAGRAVGAKIGMIRLENVYLASPSGIIIDRANGLIFHGHTIGWAGASVVSDQLRDHHQALISECGKVLLDSAKFDGARSYECLRLTSAAGYSIYGHWLIDVVPRLLLCSAFSRERQAPFYGPLIRGWGYALAAAAGVDISHRVQSQLGELVFAKTVEIPTFIRYSVVLDEGRSVAAWEKLKTGRGLTHDIPRSDGTLLYVSRVKWGSRTLSNANEVEGWVRSYGFRVVHPETMTFEEQIAVFGSARVIIGEDGSGMHNSVFAEHNVYLGIISMGRTNLYHASIANARRQSVSYLSAAENRLSESATTWTLDRSVLEQYLDEIGLPRHR